MSPRLFLNLKSRRDFLAATQRRLAAAPADLAAWQMAAVCRIWSDAIADVPYYGELVASGRAPREIGSWADFRSIPILTRQELQDRPASFLRRSEPPDGFAVTAGSTGTPLRVGMNQAERDRMRIVKLAAWQEFGYTPSSRLFLIWGHSHLLGTGWRGRINHLRRKAADWALGYQRVDAYRLSPAVCAHYAEQLLRCRPLGLIGYASALDLFARYTPQFRARFRALGLRFVLSTAEPPPRADTFPLLEDLFGAPVVQEYGAAEVGQIAFKSGAAPFETYSDLNYVECVSPTDDEVGGQPVLVTSLYQRYAPLIRYQMGDSLIGLERLPQGHVQRFTGLAGRLNDVIQLKDGQAIHSVAIFHCIHQETSVQNIQMVVRDNGIEIRLINTRANDAAMKERIRKRLAQVHPMLAQARILDVEDLETNRAGKRRWFVDERRKASADVRGT